jgi:hypothetical protein
VKIYMVQAKRYVLDTKSIDLCANHIFLSARDSAKSSPKETKEDKRRNREKLVDCVAPDILVPPTGQSGARSSHTRCSRIFLATSAIIHRTVRARHGTVRYTSCATASGHVSARPTVNRCTGQSGAPEAKTSQSGDSLPCPGRVLFTVQCTPDSPVHPRIEGNNGLPNEAPTTSSCLRAIKGTPRHMEQYTKLPLNILRRLDSAITHMVHCD